jgi:hypothetical protein
MWFHERHEMEGPELRFDLLEGWAANFTDVVRYARRAFPEVRFCGLTVTTNDCGCNTLSAVKVSGGPRAGAECGLTASLPPLSACAPPNHCIRTLPSPPPSYPIQRRRCG